MEEANEKMREEIRELMDRVRNWRVEQGGMNYQNIVTDLHEMKCREKNREKENKELREEVTRIVKLNQQYSEEIEKLKTENEELRKSVFEGATVRAEGDVMKEVKNLMIEEKKTWKEEKEQQKIEMKEIIRQQQQQERDKDIEKRVVQIIKEKDKLVRDTVQKKMCVVVFGAKEKNIPMKINREKEEVLRAKEIISQVAEGEEITEQIEEVHRIGKYEEGRERPMRIRFMTQTAAEHVLKRTGKLAKIEEMKKIWIRRDMNEEERNKLKELRVEAQTKNETRTQEQTKKFIWRVVDEKVRKWWLKDPTEGQQEEN